MAAPLIKAYTVFLTNNCFSDVQGLGPYRTHGQRIQENYDPKGKKSVATVHDMIARCHEQGFTHVVFATLDGLKYQSHPEIAVENAWSREELKKELDYAKSLGLKTVPMLNFSAAHDTWMGEMAKKLSTPAYRDFCRDLIDELCQLFEEPELFHLGLDSETAQEQADHLHQVVRGDALWQADLAHLLACCRKNNARPWMFADRYRTGAQAFLQAVDKNVLLCTTAVVIPAKVLQEDYTYFFQLSQEGYEYTILSSCHLNIAGAEHAISQHLNNADTAKLAGFVSYSALPCVEDYRFKLIYELEETAYQIQSQYENAKEAQQ